MKTCILCESTSAGVLVRFPNGTKICSWCRAELKKTARGFCPHCERAYPIAEMSDGYCRPHKRAFNKAYREKNHERELARVAAWKKAHPRPHTKAERRRWYVAHTEREKARSRTWHAANKERAAAGQRRYKAAQVAENPNYWKERYQRAKVRTFRRLFG